MNEAIAQTIKELRKQNNISQEKLAESIDSHQVYISEIENAKKTPSIHILKQIAQVFGLSLTDFVSRIEKKIK